jgi:hypothetical protein
VRTRTFLATLLFAVPATAQTPVTWGAIADNGQGYYGIIAPERCVAYAHSANGQASGYGAAATRQQAEQSAWNECNARVPSSSCQLQGVRCFE